MINIAKSDRQTQDMVWEDLTDRTDKTWILFTDILRLGIFRASFWQRMSAGPTRPVSGKRSPRMGCSRETFQIPQFPPKAERLQAIQRHWPSFWSVSARRELQDIPLSDLGPSGDPRAAAWYAACDPPILGILVPYLSRNSSRETSAQGTFPG